MIPTICHLVKRFSRKRKYRFILAPLVVVECPTVKKKKSVQGSNRAPCSLFRGVRYAMRSHARFGRSAWAITATNCLLRDTRISTRDQQRGDNATRYSCNGIVANVRPHILMSTKEGMGQMQLILFYIYICIYIFFLLVTVSCFAFFHIVHAYYSYQSRLPKAGEAGKKGQQSKGTSMLANLVSVPSPSPSHTPSASAAAAELFSKHHWNALHKTNATRNKTTNPSIDKRPPPPHRTCLYFSQ